MAKRKQAKRPAPISDTAPTPEQMNAGEFRQGGNMATSLTERAGLAYRRVPVIDTLLATGKLTRRQHDALVRYRTAALAEYTSPQRDSLDKALNGRSNGHGLPPGLLRASSELKYMDGKLHCKARIATTRAITVDDKSPSQWAIELYGGTTRKRQRGQWEVICIEPRRIALETVQLEIAEAGDILADAT